MKALPSLETRWFHPGKPSSAATKWFAAVGSMKPGFEKRDDDYLSLPNVDFLGVKFRQGKLEVKRREVDGGVRIWEPGIAGAVGQWHKWSLGLDKNSKDSPDRGWIKVGKTRLLRKFSVSKGGRVQEIDSQSKAERGCTLELTTLLARGWPWWTIGFEAFGDEDDRALSRTLQTVVAHLLSIGKPPTLRRVHSYDYPRWLANLRPKRKSR